jgi:MSHA biogenesis protein MshJ
MKARLERWAVRFDALSLRERAMIFAAVAVVVVFLANLFIIQRQSDANRALTNNIKSQQAQLSDFEAQRHLLEQALAADVDAANRARLQRAQQELSQLESELALAQRGLVSAERMPVLLQEILRQHQGLQLVELRTLPIAVLIDHSKDDKASAGGDAAATASAKNPAVGDKSAPVPGGDRNLYKHGFEITVRGSYPEFVEYLSQLEHLPTRMYWSKVTVNGNDYPQVTLTATIYTLSLDKAWLAV